MNSITATIQNLISNRKRYRTHSEAVIIACYYNPENNPYRILAFQKWYKSIKHLNHRIVELTIGHNAKRQLPSSPHITHQHADTLLWHKETLLNQIIKNLPAKYKYVFWLDTDVLFTNLNWLTDSVRLLANTHTILQPFEYCIHMQKGQLTPTDIDLTAIKNQAPITPNEKHPRVWRSFGANHATTATYSCDVNYDRHGHVGFAWGARREVLDKCPLYDKALVGGADHIIAHAAAGHFDHACIRKAFTESRAEIHKWSCAFYRQTTGLVTFTYGDLYHIWHGDLKDREYLKRITDFDKLTAEVNERDSNGLYTAGGKPQEYCKKYYRKREHTGVTNPNNLTNLNTGFAEEMGYTITDWLTTFPPPVEEVPEETIPQESQPPSFFQAPEPMRDWTLQEKIQMAVEAAEANPDHTELEVAPPPHEPTQAEANPDHTELEVAPPPHEPSQAPDNCNYS
jgi:hypothetical protein